MADSSDKKTVKVHFKVSGKAHPIAAATRSASAPTAGTYLIETRPGGWIILENKKTGERIKAQSFRSGERFQVSLRGELWNGHWIDTSMQSASQSAGASDSDLEAQFPGKIRKILVKEGQKVSAGDPLLLVEAMKMEFSIAAPFSGTVDKIRVTEGQQIMPGARYLDMKEDKS